MYCLLPGRIRRIQFYLFARRFSERSEFSDVHRSAARISAQFGCHHLHRRRGPLRHQAEREVGAGDHHGDNKHAAQEADGLAATKLDHELHHFLSHLHLVGGKLLLFLLNTKNAIFVIQGVYWLT